MIASLQTWWSDMFKHRLIALVMGVIVLVPLVTTPLSGAVPMAHNVGPLIVQIGSIIMLAALLWSNKSNLSKESVVSFVRSGINLPVILFVTFGLVSWSWAGNKTYSAQETMRILSGVILYLVVAYQFRRSEYLARLVDSLLFLSIGVSLYGFALYSQATHIDAVGPFGDHQLFGSFLMILLPIIATVAVTERNKNRQLIAQCGSVLLAANLLIAHSRSAWIGSAVGLVCLAVLALVNMRKDAVRNVVARKHETVIPVLLMVFAVGLFMAISPQSGSVVSRFATLQNAKTDQAVVYRQSMLQGAIEMVKNRPLTGYGIGQFPIEQRAFTHKGNPLQFGNIHPGLSHQAHNFYAQTAAELGIPGLTLLVSILLVFLISGTRRMLELEAGLRRNLLMGSLAAVAAFAVDAYASPAWQMGQVSLFLWLTMGIGVACGLPKAKARRVDSRPSAALKKPSAQTGPVWGKPVAALSALLLLGFITSVNASPVAGYDIPVEARLTAVPNPVPHGDNTLLILEVRFGDGNGNFTPFIDVSENGPIVNGQPDWTASYAILSDTTGRGQLASFQGPIHYSTTRVFTAPDPGSATVRGTYQETAGQKFSISAQTVITVQ